MNRLKIAATAAILSSAIALAAPSIAGGKPGCGERGPWGHEHGGYKALGGHLASKLDLTDAQKETLKTQRDANKAAMDALRTKVAAAREALASAVESGANEAELAALADDLGKLHAEKVLSGAKAHQAFLALLTDEQKQKLAELKAKREAHRKSHGERLDRGSSASAN